MVVPYSNRWQYSHAREKPETSLALDLVQIERQGRFCKKKAFPSIRF